MQSWALKKQQHNASGQQSRCVYVFGLSFCLSVPYLISLQELSSNWHKWPLGLKNELIRFWWLTREIYLSGQFNFQPTVWPSSWYCHEMCYRYWWSTEDSSHSSCHRMSRWTYVKLKEDSVTFSPKSNMRIYPHASIGKFPLSLTSQSKWKNVNTAVLGNRIKAQSGPTMCETSVQHCTHHCQSQIKTQAFLADNAITVSSRQSSHTNIVVMCSLPCLQFCTLKSKQVYKYTNIQVTLGRNYTYLRQYKFKITRQIAKRHLTSWTWQTFHHVLHLVNVLWSAQQLICMKSCIGSETFKWLWSRCRFFWTSKLHANKIRSSLLE